MNIVSATKAPIAFRVTRTHQIEFIPRYHKLVVFETEIDDRHDMMLETISMIGTTLEWRRPAWFRYLMIHFVHELGFLLSLYFLFCVFEPVPDEYVYTFSLSLTEAKVRSKRRIEMKNVEFFGN